MVRTAEKSFTVHGKEEFRLSSKHQLYKCMSWLIGIDVYKCVHLASMVVKIDRTVGGQNKKQ